jgi:hypothetical protein
MDICNNGCLENNVSNTSRESLIKEIYEIDFALIELGLFLDTHPDCKSALTMHNNYANKCRELKDKYQKMYGPLTMQFPCNKWRWLESPWPWEGSEF